MKSYESEYATDLKSLGLTKPTYSVAELVSLLGIGRTSLYQAINRGELRSVKLGRRTLFRATDVRAFVLNLQPASFDSNGTVEE